MTCPKCRGSMAGPSYSQAYARGAHEVAREALLFTCRTCGYVEAERPADQSGGKGDAHAWQRVLAGTPGGKESTVYDGPGAPMPTTTTTGSAR